ncbi:MAG: hypothetical protein WCI53_12980 [Bacteroidota bacterium]|jgi:hypothetical protein
MGYIKEPAGINFVVDPTPLTTEDRKKISEIIAYYKATGRKMQLTKSATRPRVTTKIKKVVA